MRGYVNMHGVKESNYELLPEGIYDVIIKEVSEQTSKNNDPMAVIILEVSKGDYMGSYVWDNIVFPDDNSPAVKIKGRTRHFLHAIGEPYEDKESLEYDTENWKRKPCKIKVYHDVYNGKTKAKVDNYIIDEETSDEDVPF